MFRANSQRTGCFNTIGVPQFQGVKWRTKLHHGSAPVIDDNVIYLLTSRRYVEALDIQTGQNLWKLDLEIDAPSQLILHRGTIYVTGDNGYVCAVNTQTEQRKWVSQTGIARNLDPIIIQNILCISDDDGRLSGLDSENGEILWTIQPVRAMKITPPTAGEHSVYIGSYSGNLYSADATTGSINWKTEIGALSRTAIPIISGNLVFIASEKNSIYVLDTETGQIKQIIQIGDERITRLSSLAILDEVLYVKDLGENFFAVDIRLGQEIWKAQNRQYIFANNFIATPDGLYSAHIGALHALDLETGQELWKFIAPDPDLWLLKPKLWVNQFVNCIAKMIVGIPLSLMFSCPVVSDGVVYVTCSNITYGNGYLYALH